MLIAAAAALAALLTFVSFVAPALLGSAFALALAATACRLAALLLLRRAAGAENPAKRRGFQLLFLGEALFGAAVVTGLAIEPHGEGGLAGWAGLAVWLGYGRGRRLGRVEADRGRWLGARRRNTDRGCRRLLVHPDRSGALALRDGGRLWMLRDFWLKISLGRRRLAGKLKPNPWGGRSAAIAPCRARGAGHGPSNASSARAAVGNLARISAT